MTHYSEDEVDSIVYDLAEIRDAVDKFLVAPKLGGRHANALQRLRALSLRWNASRPLEDQLRRSLDVTLGTGVEA